MSSSNEKKTNSLQIALWKKLLVSAFIAFFLLTLYRYLKGEIDGNAPWLWPMLFIPLILYLLGVVYGDVPARYYRLDRIKPFPTPFARQYDRCVLALMVLYAGLLLNIFFFAASIFFSTASFLIGLYGLYMVLMVVELPNSLRIFRFIQHINTLQYVNIINPMTFKRAVEYYEPSLDDLKGMELEDYLKQLHESLIEEAQGLVQKESPLKEDQQVALNLAVRSGEAIRRMNVAIREKNHDRFHANRLLLSSLEKHASLDIPDEVKERISKTEI